MKKVYVSGSFDDLRSKEIRFLHEAAKLGKVHLALWSDNLVAAVTGEPPEFSLPEREYLMDSVRFVTGYSVLDESSDPDEIYGEYDTWVVRQAEDGETKRRKAAALGMEYVVISDDRLGGFPEIFTGDPTPGTKQVVVTGCYDWFHSGHVRFFEEVSALGDLHVVVGNDANVEHLKGEGHPMFSEEERRYMVGSIRYVYKGYVSSGWGWLDAEPEIDRIKPDIYAVNEDGDKPEKADFCKRKGIEYVVLNRTPKEGLEKRSSTNLRGF
jgi:cytidyltransferase-like protein